MSSSKEPMLFILDEASGIDLPTLEKIGTAWARHIIIFDAPWNCDNFFRTPCDEPIVIEDPKVG